MKKNNAKPNRIDRDTFLKTKNKISYSATRENKFKNFSSIFLPGA